MIVVYELIHAVVICLVTLLYWLMPVLMPPTLPFGVRIPASRVNEPVIARLLRRYRLLIILSGLIGLLIIAGATYLMESGLTLWLAPLGLLTTLALAILVYYLMHRQLRAIKEGEDWYAGLREVIVVEVPSSQESAHLSRFWLTLNALLLAGMLAISMLRYPALPARIVTHYNASSQPDGWGGKDQIFLLPLLALLLSGSLVALALYLPHLRKSLDPSAPEESRRDRQRQRRAWSDLLLSTAAITNAIFLLATLVISQALPGVQQATLLLSLLPVLLVVLFILIIFYLYRGRQRRAYESHTNYVMRDDDRYWIAGLFYVNRDDPALLVERRFGVGWTLNLGHPLGVAIMIGLLVLVAGALLVAVLAGSH